MPTMSVCVTEMYPDWQKGDVMLPEHACKSGNSLRTTRCVKKQLIPGLAKCKPSVYWVFLQSTETPYSVCTLFILGEGGQSPESADPVNHGSLDMLNT